MAAHATRSASGADSSSDDVSRCLLLALSHDELGVIVDGLADPLQPVVAVALSSTCLGLRTPLHEALEVLKERHGRAVAMCRKVGTSCMDLLDAEELGWNGKGELANSQMEKGLTTDDMATLGMILRTNGLPRMQKLYLSRNGFSDAGMQALCEGMDSSAAPSLRSLGLVNNKLGLLGAEALAAAIRRGAMPQLASLLIEFNFFVGNQGVATLAPALRKLPALAKLFLCGCDIDDEGVASLFANLGKDDFKKLKILDLRCNKVSDKGCEMIASLVNSGKMPSLTDVLLQPNPMSPEAAQAVKDALRARQ